MRTLVNEPKEAGYYRVAWDGTDHYGNDAASGIYFYGMTVEGFTATRSKVLIKETITPFHIKKRCGSTDRKFQRREMSDLIVRKNHITKGGASCTKEYRV
jgi:hypothetical protein